MKNIKNIAILVLVALCLVLSWKSCKPNRKVTTKIDTYSYPVKEPIMNVEIGDFKTVYYKTTKTLKGKDSIVYVDKIVEGGKSAKQYSTTLKSNRASADLKITTSGELLDVSGNITYPKDSTVVERTIHKPMSGLFMEYNGNAKNLHEINLDYTFKNSVRAGIGVMLAPDGNTYGTFKIGARIW